MKKSELISKVKEALEIEDTIFNETTSLSFSSMDVLSLIILVDENFNMQLKAADINRVKTISDLMSLIGNDKFTEE